MDRTPSAPGMLGGRAEGAGAPDSALGGAAPPPEHAASKAIVEVSTRVSRMSFLLNQLLPPGLGHRRDSYAPGSSRITGKVPSLIRTARSSVLGA